MQPQLLVLLLLRAVSACSPCSDNFMWQLHFTMLLAHYLDISMSRFDIPRYFFKVNLSLT